MRCCVHLLIAVCLLSCRAGLAEANQPAGARPPNIVILLADDLGYADLGFQGCRDIPTPQIDRLTKGGVRCTNGYVSGPYCSPTRAGLLTGRYQQRFGHEFNPGGKFGLPLSETTLANRLKSAGYATGIVGKWHLGAAAGMPPPQRGFDEFFGFLGGAHTYFPKQKTPMLRGTEPDPERGYLTDAFGREAVDFIERHKAHPFMLYLAFNAVHTPMEATAERLARFASIRDETRRTYAAMTVAMDEAIGRVLDKLQAAGLEEETLIFFFSDNGGPTMRSTTINGSSNAPLRGSKRTTLEGGIHVPFVVQWKGRLPAGTVYEKPVIQLDVLPTALAAAGVAVDPAWKLDGVNLLPYLTGKDAQAPHDRLYWRFGEQMALREGDWKLVRYDSMADGNNRPTTTPTKLYNLADDIGETHDLAGQHPEKVKALEATWQTWNRQLVDPLWASGKSRGRE